ncbi:MAG: endosialidase [Clostridiales bacterium]|jgi:hypothetical protein|nr:endosialidase [Clostridiales bacterium]
MPTAIQPVIAAEGGALRFGDYTVKEKQKKDGFEFGGETYSVKTHDLVTRLERGGILAVETVPGTAVSGYRADADSVVFEAEGTGDTQITLGLAQSATYELFSDGESMGMTKTNRSGKAIFSVDLSEGSKKIEARLI